MSPTRLLFEGPDIHSLLARVREEYGSDVTIVAADRVRTRGLAGFFARERYEVAVEVEAGPGAAPSPSPTETPASFALNLVDDVDAAERVLVASRSHDPDIRSVLEHLRRDLGPEPVRAPVTTAEPAAAPARPVPRDALGPDAAAVLLAAGLPREVVDGLPAGDDLVAALTTGLTALAARPHLPAGPGEVVAVVGDGPAVLAAARGVAALIGSAGARILVAAPEGSAHADGPSRLFAAADAGRAGRRLARRQGPTVVAVDGSAHPLPVAWTTGVLDALDTSAVCAVVDARHRTRDLRAALAGLGRVDALAAVAVAHTVEPAAVLTLGAPVATLDGAPSGPRPWARLLASLVAGGVR